jgi:hypothetical protein
MGISEPFKTIHSEHLSRESCSAMGYTAEPGLRPKSVVKVTKAEIGDPNNFDHVKHISENPLKVMPTDYDEVF